MREPNLSVVVFRRLGWKREQYYAWSDRLLAANFAFVLPTTHYGETVTRFAVVNPRTTEADVAADPRHHGGLTRTPFVGAL